MTPGIPIRRLRRLRQSSAWRAMVRETSLSASDFVYPLFVVPGRGMREPVASMPGVHRHSVDRVVEEAAAAHEAGVPAVILFGVPETKDATGAGAGDEAGVVPEAVQAIKAAVPELLVWTDVCLCSYTEHGHCGIADETGQILNDESLPQLAAAALAHAGAGADAVAPSDMMDGRVDSLRRALDEAGHTNTPIVSYAAKFASAYYGPFRDAADSTPAFGDRRTYQMDPANGREALAEMVQDVAEGADIIMVKPAMAYLDILASARESLDVPLAAYHVSGEYSMIKAAAERGWIDEQAVVLESLTAIRRAGADMILTYYAKEAARWLQR